MCPSKHNLAVLLRLVYTLRHIETGEFVCLREGGRDYPVVFTEGASARCFCGTLRLVEFVDISPIRLGSVPFECYYLDGKITSRTRLSEEIVRCVP